MGKMVCYQDFDLIVVEKMELEIVFCYEYVVYDGEKIWMDLLFKVWVCYDDLVVLVFVGNQGCQ